MIDESGYPKATAASLSAELRRMDMERRDEVPTWLADLLERRIYEDGYWERQGAEA